MMVRRCTYRAPLSGTQGDDGDYDDDGGDEDGDTADDDMYIVMQCLCVCLSLKMINSHFRAERWRREVSCPLGLAGRRPALA